MATRDKFHQECKIALEKDGWIITHDPYRLKVEKKRSYPIDLGAEKVIAAEKGTEKIAVEIKSFLQDSLANAFHEAAGQYIGYFLGLSQQEPDRVLYLALPEQEYIALEEVVLAQMVIEHLNIRLIVFNVETQNIVKWKN